MTHYVTTAIPYVNAAPHLGHALEGVLADVLARHWRQVGHEVRFLSGTDDYAITNVLAAEAAGLPIDEFVSAQAAQFESLGKALRLSLDDYIKTSSDPRHRPGVERLWLAVQDADDLYRREYVGLYCVRCEAFYEPDHLDGVLCPDHLLPVEEVAEENWFFRLSRYEQRLLKAIESGELRIEPEQRRNEVLGFIRSGLRDISVSRSVERAHGWGIGVPDDPDQVVYVWFDALGNYITTLGYGSGDPAYQRWWLNSDRRVHVIGKGILRFHAVYWPAFLLSAGEPLPTDILVHDYVRADGHPMSKTRGNTVDPIGLVDRYGVDAVRWWCAAKVRNVGETDFTEDGVVAAANRDLAGGIGNLVARIIGLTADTANRAGLGAFNEPISAARSKCSHAIERLDLRAAAHEIRELLANINRHLEHHRPWAQETDPAVVETAASATGVVVDLLAAIVPEVALSAQPRLDGRTVGPVYQRIE